MSKSISDLARETEERKIAEEKKLKANEQIKNNSNIEQKHKMLMFHTAFVPKWFTKFSIILFFSFAAVFITYLVMNYPKMHTLISVALIIAALTLSVLLTYLISRAIRALFIIAGTKQVKHVAYNWDSETYKEILSTEFFNLKLILRLAFNSSVPAERQKQVSAALESLTNEKLIEGTILIWTADDHAEMISPEIKAYKYHHPGGYEPYNREVHKWFTYIIEKVLPIIHREYPIKELKFSTDNKEKKNIHFERRDY